MIGTQKSDDDCGRNWDYGQAQRQVLTKADLAFISLSVQPVSDQDKEPSPRHGTVFQRLTGFWQIKYIRPLHSRRVRSLFSEEWIPVLHTNCHTCPQTSANNCYSGTMESLIYRHGISHRIASNQETHFITKDVLESSDLTVKSTGHIR